MAIKIVLLGYVSAALLDAGMRDEKLSQVPRPEGLAAGVGTYKILPADRASCIDTFRLPGTVLKNGLTCSECEEHEVENGNCVRTHSANAVSCVTAFEHKHRGDHRNPDNSDDVGHSLKGEVHLCEWKEHLAGHKCEAGKVLEVCPDDDVVQVTNAGVQAGDQKLTGLLPTDSAGLPAAMQPYTHGSDNTNYDKPHLETSLAQGGAKKEKAQGKCGQDAYTCSTGETVLRDPLLSCRFAPCAGQTSLVEESNAQPTYQWTGVSIADDQNFCERMTPILGNYQDLQVTSCVGLTETYCENHYKHVLDGNVGDIEHCRWNAATTGCEDGAIHNCTWSFFMEDLIRKHNTTQDNCAAKLLEAKRSLDGLLHSVQDVYNQLMQWNAIVQAENGTIRGLLQEQQEDWDTYVSDQQSCDSMYQTDVTALEIIEAEMTELRAIANPDVRSAVDLRRARGYQSSGVTSMSCPAEFPFVSTAAAAGASAYCCLATTDVAFDPPSDTGNCTHRDCRDERDNVVACQNNARGNTKYGAGLLTPSQTAADAASFAEMDESACQTFTSLVERVEKKHGVTILLKTAGDCHQMRSDLNADFQTAFKTLGDLYNLQIRDMEENRTICLNKATYEYKAGVEGIDGIDDQIQDAAGKIHEAQGEIARLEPMLHDVERAVDRMRAYVTTVAEECGDEAYLGNVYEDIKNKIVALQECPGRNDFIINIPHWRPQTPTTPSPTPWYENDLAAGVRSQL